MSLRDLKNLAPWQWESKVAQKKHAIGPKGIADFEQVERVLQLRSDRGDSTQLTDKQLASAKRRRATKENDQPADSTVRSPSVDAELAAAAPSIPAKKQRHTSTDNDNVLPSKANASDRPSLVAEATVAGGTQAPAAAAACTGAAGTPAPDAKRPKSLAALASALSATTPAAIATPAAAGKAGKAAYAAACIAAVRSAAAAATKTPAAACKDTSQGPSSSSTQHGSSSTGTASASTKIASKALQSPGSCLKTPAGQILKTRQVRTVPAAAAAPAASPRTAVATPASLTPRDLLSEVFSPSPVPTPMPCARLAFKTPHSTARPHVPGSMVPEGPAPAGSDVAGIAAGANRNSSSHAAISGTPLPRPQFTPRSMPPPARRISGSGTGLSMQQQHQTPGRSAAAGVSHSISSSKAVQPPIDPAVTPVDGSSQLAAIAAAAAAAEKGCSSAAPAEDVQIAAATAAVIGGFVESLVSPVGYQGLESIGADDVDSSSCKLPAPALLHVVSTASARGAAVGEPSVVGDQGSNRVTPPAAVASAAATASSMCLPAKLRCKKASYISTVAAVVADQQEQQGQEEQGVAAPGATAGPEAVSAAAAALSTPAAPRFGLKRRWCQDHAAAMAAAVAADDDHAGSMARSPDSMAVARSADLLLAAAAAADDDHGLDHDATGDHGDLDLQHPETLDHVDAEPAAAVTDMDLDLDISEQQQHEVEPQAVRKVHSEVAAVPAAPDETAQLRHGNPVHKATMAQHQQMASCKGTAVLDLSDVVTAANAVPGSSCGTSLLLPAAAQARLQLLQQQDTTQQQQQIPKLPVQVGANDDAIAAVAKSAPSTQNMQQQQPMLLQHIQLQQQQLFAAAGVRVPHATAAAHNAATRVMHSGAVVQQTGPVMHRAAGAAHFGVWNGHLVLLQAHQQQQLLRRSQSPAAAAAAMGPRSRSATPDPAAAAATATAINTSTAAPQAAASKPLVHPATAAGAAHTANSSNTLNPSDSCNTLNPKDLAVTPLLVPGTLSDDDAWKLAQSQPWVIELEAARARQLLAHAAVIAAAAAAAAQSS